MLVVEVIDARSIQIIHYTATDPNETDAMPTSVQGTGMASFGLAFSSGSGSVVQGLAMVYEEVITLDPTNETIEVIRYGAGIFVCSPADAIDRARSKIGEQLYNLFNNNCESMVNWALTGQGISKQGDLAKIVLVGGGIAVGVGVTAIAVAAIGVAAILGAITGEKKK